MGVDYYQCDSCNLGYRDDSDTACSCDCGSMFCRHKCGKLENWAEMEEPEEDDPKYQAWLNGNCRIDMDKPTTCVICRKEKENDRVLLYALFEHYGITRDQAFEIYKKQKG